MTGSLLSTVHDRLPAQGNGRGSLEDLVFGEMRLTMRLISVLRIVAAGVLAVLALLLWKVEGSFTRFAIVIGLTLGILAWTLWESAGVDARTPVTRRCILSGLGGGFAFQTVLIVFTGGIESPFIVLYIPVMMVLAVVLGRRPIFMAALLVPAATIGLLVVVRVVDAFSGLLPSFLADPLVHDIFAGLVVIGAMIIGGNAGLSARKALDRSVQVAAEARDRTFDMVVERNRELIELSGALAHELKNPLTAIQGLSSVLVRRMPEASRESEQMNVLLAEVKRMGSILEEFLNFSRPARDLSLTEVTPAALIDDVVRLHEVYASRRGIGFYLRLDTDRPLRCDPRKIKQVLVNLVQNALDASPAGGQIALGVRCQGDDELIFTVDDRGPGLSDEVRGRLFTPGTTTKAAGSGLGLTIARAIAHQHGGTLTIADGPEGGCRAIFTLPLRFTDGSGRSGSQKPELLDGAPPDSAPPDSASPDSASLASAPPDSAPQECPTQEPRT